MRADRRAEAGIGAFDQRLAVDGMGQRLTHFHIVERRLGIVERQQNLARRIANFHLKLVVTLEAADKFRGLEHREGIDIARKDGGGGSRRIADEPEGHGGKLCRLAPVIRVALKLHAVALHPALELERAGADRLGLVPSG